MEFVRCGEDADEYEQLEKGLYEQFQPIGRAEELEVDVIINCWWKSKREERFEVAKTSAAVIAAEDRGKLRRLRYFKAKERKEKAAKVYLENAQKKILATDRVPRGFESEVKRFTFKHEWSICDQLARQQIDASNLKKKFPDITPEQIDATRTL